MNPPENVNDDICSFFVGVSSEIFVYMTLKTSGQRIEGNEMCAKIIMNKKCNHDKESKTARIFRGLPS